jgi:hypothetical protein
MRAIQPIRWSSLVIPARLAAPPGMTQGFASFDPAAHDVAALAASLQTKQQGGAQGALAQRRSAPAAGNAPSFVGMQLGTKSDSEAVVVKREIGSTRGYDERRQAIAVARMGGAMHAAVVQDENGRWHALETTASFHDATFHANETPTRAVYGLPSAARIEAQQREVAQLTQELAALDPDPAPRDRRAVETKRSDLVRDLGHARSVLASLVLGVGESELQFNAKSSGRSVGMVNITTRPDAGSPGGAHAPVLGQGGDITFRPGLKTAIEIDLPQLDRPTRAQAVLFHETQHLHDYELAQHWVQRYERERAPFVAGPAGRKPLEDWLKQQVTQGRLSAADAELVADEAADRTSTTEARANVRSFLATLQAGASDQAQRELVAYARALPPGRQYAAPPPGSKVTAALVAECRAEYQQMTPEQRKAYDTAVAAALKANPSARIGQLQFAK